MKKMKSSAIIFKTSKSATPWLRCLLVVFLFALSWQKAWGLEPLKGTNSGHFISFPSAMEQSSRHMFHGTLEVFDLGETDLRVENVRYGFQHGNFRLQADFNFFTPFKEFDYNILRGQLKILPLDEYRTSFALGLLRRAAFNLDSKARIQNKFASVYAVVTSELFPFNSYNRLRLNFYLDNLYASFGAKLKTHAVLDVMGEVDWIHEPFEELPTTVAGTTERVRGKIGLELEGEQNFYFQIFLDSRFGNVAVQVGSGF